MDVERSQNPFSKLVRDSIDENRVDRILDGIDSKLQKPQSGRASTYVLSAVGVGLTALLVVVIAIVITDDTPEAPEISPELGPIAVVGLGPMQVIEANQQKGRSQRFELSDGSTIELDAGTTLRASKNTARDIELHLEKGRARFNITPGGPRRWTIDAELATIEVLGTEFVVERTDHRVDIAVSRGQISVSSELLEESPRVLEAGLSIVVEIEENTPTTQPPAQTPAKLATKTKANKGPSWQQLARDGDFEKAYEILGKQGITREMNSSESLDHLLLLAKVARLSGHAREAVAPLEGAIKGYPTDRRTALAAFTLGRLEADVLDRPQRAARAFQQSIKLGIPSALRENAFARLVEVHSQAGNDRAALKAAHDYLRHYPDSRRADKLRRWIDKR